ncbi:MAG: class I SAM-dependent methyltransferase [Acidimicrobiales bacterium]
MGFYERQVLPRVIDKVMGTKGFAKLRARAARALSGEILEVGFGSGLNVPHYPPAVTKVYAVDPSEVGRRLAETRVADATVPIEFVGLDGEHLPLEDASVDEVFTTWTLCTIPHVELALAEMIRVLRPGGRFHFLEHGHSPDPKVARWQARLDPIQQRIGGGCHLTRPIDALVEDAGFEIEHLANFYIAGPKSMSYSYAGRAVRP